MNSPSGDFYVAGKLARPALHRLDDLRVEPKVMAVLCVLAEQDGDVVLRETFNARVWDGAAVSDDVLSRCISELRRVLDDGGRARSVIETVPKRGYRLTVPVRYRRGPLAPRRRSLARTATGLAIVGVLVAVWMLAPPRPPASTGGATTLALNPETSLPGHEFTPAISPDGTTLTFAWNDSRPSVLALDLFVQPIGSAAAPRRLTSLPGSEFAPRFSPAGDRLLFRYANPRGEIQLRVVDIASGRQRIVARSHDTEALPEWDADGLGIVFPDRDPESGVYGLVAVDLRTEALEWLTRSNAADRAHQQPAVSPSGAQVAFVEGPPGRGRLMMLNRATGSVRVLTAEEERIDGIDWLDERTLVFATDRSGNFELWSLDIDTAALQQLTRDEGSLRYPSYASASGTLVAAHARVDANVWWMDLRADPDDFGVPLLASTRQETAARYAHAGRRIAFVSDRTGNPEVWLSEEGQPDRRLTNLEGVATSAPSWSPQDDWIVFDSRVGGYTQVFRVHIESGRVEQLTDADSNQRVPSYAADGASLLFASDRSGAWQVWRRPFDGGTEQQLTRQGGYLARESRDGRDVYYTRYRESGLWRTDALGRDAEVRILGAPSYVFWGAWSLRPDGIYVLTTRPGASSSLLRYSPATDAVERLKTFHNGPPWHTLGLDVAPDGQSVLYTQLDSSVSDIVSMRIR